MTDDLQEDKIRELKTKLFGSGATNIPRPLLEILNSKVTMKQADAAQIASFSRYDKDEFGAFWLDGNRICDIVFRGSEHNLSAEESAYPLSSVSSVKTIYNFTYDDFRRRYSWTRRVTFEFRDREPIILDNVEDDSTQDRFVRAILTALAKVS